MHERLRSHEFSSLRVGLLHGRMSADDKEATMADFKSGAIDVLVATTVIEVGVDVPNANIMVIEHAERFGLSQLHQLRGRIGRGAAKSYCILMTGGKVSIEAQQRLDAMVRAFMREYATSQTRHIVLLHDVDFLAEPERTKVREQERELKRAAAVGFAVTAVFGAAIGALSWPFAGQIAALYTTDAQTIALAAGALTLCAVFYLPDGMQVVSASHTDRQSTLLVRTSGPVLDPAWTVSEVGLEDLVLAYMSQAAGQGRRNRHLEVQK